jgi:hypothetical protein
MRNKIAVVRKRRQNSLRIIGFDYNDIGKGDAAVGVRALAASQEHSRRGRAWAGRNI